jgi:hypothetical protein
VSSYYAEHEPVSVALRRPGPFWFDDLASVLAEYRWSRFQAECGLDRSNYGTARALDRNSHVERNVIGHLRGPTTETQHRIIVECLRSDITKRYRDFGLEFYSPVEILGSNLLSILDRAIQIIANVPGAALAVSAVLSVVHILKPGSPEYDISYSEPTLPFSIFVGIDPRLRVNPHLRLAESILHECMHLQLTLIEERTPLIGTDNEHHLSPWRQTLRPTRGVLHALYVFRVIQEFFSALLVSVILSEDEYRHIQGRLRDIEIQVGQTGDLSSSQDLTPAGQALVERLQAGDKPKAQTNKVSNRRP